MNGKYTALFLVIIGLTGLILESKGKLLPALGIVTSGVPAKI